MIDLRNSDCMNEDIGIPSIPDESIDLIVTDVPFGVEFQNNKFFDDSKEYVFSQADKWLEQFSRVLKEGSHCYIYVPVLEIDFWVSTVKKYLKYNNKLVVSCYTTNRYIKNNFCFDTQDILYCSKGKAKRLNKVDWIRVSKAWYNDKRNENPKEWTYQYPSFLPKYYRSNVKPNKAIKLLHPNQKSLDLIEQLVLLSSNEGDTVLDPFMGSGSVGVACKKLNRDFIGYEINDSFFEIGDDRINRSVFVSDWFYPFL